MAGRGGRRRATTGDIAHPGARPSVGADRSRRRGRRRRRARAGRGRSGRSWWRGRVGVRRGAGLHRDRIGSGRRGSMGWWPRSGARRGDRTRPAVARPGAGGRSVELSGAARRIAPPPRCDAVVGRQSVVWERIQQRHRGWCGQRRHRCRHPGRGPGDLRPGAPPVGGHRDRVGSRRSGDLGHHRRCSIVCGSGGHRPLGGRTEPQHRCRGAGPAPGGLGPADAGRLIGRPVLAAMRPQPGIEAQLDCGGLRLRPRAPLVRAARKVLALVSRRPENGRVSELVA